MHQPGHLRVRGLKTLAKRINKEHRACEAAVNDALEHAFSAGKLLVEAKGKCPHGSWTLWLEENFAGSVRTAQAYIRVHLRRDELEEQAKTQSAAFLSVSGALQLLGEPRTQRVEVDPGYDVASATVEAVKTDPVLGTRTIKQVLTKRVTVR